MREANNRCNKERAGTFGNGLPLVVRNANQAMELVNSVFQHKDTVVRNERNPSPNAAPLVYARTRSILVKICQRSRTRKRARRQFRHQVPVWRSVTARTGLEAPRVVHALMMRNGKLVSCSISTISMKRTMLLADPSFVNKYSTAKMDSVAEFQAVLHASCGGGV